MDKEFTVAEMGGTVRVVDMGDGQMAIVGSSRVISNMVASRATHCRRAGDRAERHGHGSLAPRWQRIGDAWFTLYDWIYARRNSLNTEG